MTETPYESTNDSLMTMFLVKIHEPDEDEDDEEYDNYGDDDYDDE